MNIKTITKKTELTLENITPLFLWTLTGLHITLVAIFAGIVYVNPTYIENLSLIIRIFVCLFLIVRFHPFRENHELHKYDGQIIFIAALFLLTNEGLTKYVLTYFDKDGPNENK